MAGYKQRKSKKMREKPTSAELIMLGRLEMSGMKFRHQCPLGIYIADFFIPSKLVVIEVDGSYHDSEKQQKKDKARDKYLTTMGATVIRVQNEDAASFELRLVRDMPDATASEIGKVMGRSGSWGKAVSAKYRKRRKIKDRAGTHNQNAPKRPATS